MLISVPITFYKAPACLDRGETTNIMRWFVVMCPTSAPEIETQSYGTLGKHACKTFRRSGRVYAAGMQEVTNIRLKKVKLTSLSLHLAKTE